MCCWQCSRSIDLPSGIEMLPRPVTSPVVIRLRKSQSTKKKQLYELKDRGIVLSHINGWLDTEGPHGAITVYRGDGFCFHSFLRPADHKIEHIDNKGSVIFVESKPKTKKEMRLCDAIATLTQIGDSLDGFVRVSSPTFARTVHDYPDDDDDCYVDEWRDE